MRRAIFEDGSVHLRHTPGVRRRGRPRQKWANFVHGHAVAAVGGIGRLQESLLDQGAWTRTTQHYLKSLRASVQREVIGRTEQAEEDKTAAGNLSKEGVCWAFAREEWQ